MILKYLIPFDRFVIRSPLSSAAAGEALQAVVEPRKFLRVGAGSRDFEGEVENGHFKIARQINYRNSFRPVVAGTIEPAPGGSVIRVTLRPSIFVMIFCLVWLNFVVSVGTSLVQQTSLAELQANPVVLMPFGMVIFFLVIINGGFWTEANKQRHMLKTLFNAIESQSTVT